jgi:hypothetical protein
LRAQSQPCSHVPRAFQYTAFLSSAKVTSYRSAPLLLRNSRTKCSSRTQARQ